MKIKKLQIVTILGLIAVPALVYAATTFSTYRVAVNEIALIIATEEQRYDRSIAELQKMEDNLSALTGTYGTLVTEINAGATANPSNPAWQALKAEKDLLVLDRAALLTKVRDHLTSVGLAYE